MTEDHVSQVDWVLEFPVNFVFDLSEAVLAQTQAVDTMEAFIKAIDADTTLGRADDVDGGVIQGAKVISADQLIELVDEARSTLVFPCRVQVQQFV